MVFFHRFFLVYDLHTAKKIVNLTISFLEDALTTLPKLVSYILYQPSQLVHSIIEY